MVSSSFYAHSAHMGSVDKTWRSKRIQAIFNLKFSQKHFHRLWYYNNVQTAFFHYSATSELFHDLCFDLSKNSIRRFPRPLLVWVVKCSCIRLFKPTAILSLWFSYCCPFGSFGECTKIYNNKKKREKGKIWLHTVDAGVLVFGSGTNTRVSAHTHTRSDTRLMQLLCVYVCVGVGEPMCALLCTCVWWISDGSWWSAVIP